MKRFISHIIMMIIPVILVIAYYTVCVAPHRHGDLGRLGFIAFEDEYDSCLVENALDSYNVVEIDDINNIDNIDNDSSILTIGDSFSQMGRLGYQNYISVLCPDHKIYNLSPLWKEYNVRMQYIADLIISDSILSSIVILESVERLLIPRLADLDFSVDNARKRLEEYRNAILSNKPTLPASDKTKNFVGDVVDFKNVCYDYILQTQEYIKKSLDIDNPVKHLKLRNKAFTCKGKEDDLYFYIHDLDAPSKEEITEAKAKIDTLFMYADRKNVKLILVAACDKYDFYKPLMVNDDYAVPGNLDYFAGKNNDIHFVDTKVLLRPYLTKGEKDIYKCNDTHWNINTSMRVAKEIKRRLDSYYNNRIN